MQEAAGTRSQPAAVQALGEIFVTAGENLEDRSGRIETFCRSRCSSERQPCIRFIFSESRECSAKTEPT